jgi:NADH-quinone oxidoreductase subunit G
MPTLTIDGKPITVPEGTTVLQACEKAQSPIPFYCYHPGLSIAGNCRICLVEIEKSPKLMIGCHTKAVEGMAVHTNSERVLKARQEVLEFILANHPLDCPVCDQAGECWLQDYYMAYGLYDPKFNEKKVKKSKKATLIGPNVMLDMERCILCSRCVRFTDEITKTGELGIFNRGDHSELGVHSGKKLDDAYSGCVVDICPVGALTDVDFRFKCRVWYLASAKSVCPGCSRGCNIEIHTNREREKRPHVASGARIMRLKPRYNPDVNQWWMCDEGRYSYHSVDEKRITEVYLKQSGVFSPASWERALSQVSDKISLMYEKKSLGRAALLLSTHQMNEDLYVGFRIFSGLEIKSIAAQPPSLGKTQDDFLIKPDKSPNKRGAEALGISLDASKIIERAKIGEIDFLYVCHTDIAVEYGNETANKIREKVGFIVFQGTSHNRTSELADIVLPNSSYAEKEGTFTNFQGRVQKINPACKALGDARPDWQIFFDLAKLQDMPWIFSSVDAVFKNIAHHITNFSGMSYETVGDSGELLKK